MTLLQNPRNESNFHKKRRVFRTSKGQFILVKCKDCSETTLCYSHSQTDKICSGCSSPILKSTGGRSKILNGAGVRVSENIY